MTFQIPPVPRAGLLAALALTAPAWAAQPASLAEAARQVCRGEVKSETLVTEAVARAKAVAELNAFVTIDEAGALAAARRIDAVRPAGRRKCLPLLGVPIVVKDNIEVAGLPSTAGTPALKGYVPKVDAPVVARLRKAGAIVLAKTNMHELAFGISGYNPTFQSGPEPGVRNAYDSSRSAGGSSSGTGAALGARVVLAGLGTDTGGSVRIPCAFNGCVALRPTVGRYPAGGIAPISHTRDTAGAMAAGVADVALMDSIIKGSRPLRPVKAVPLRRVRLGLVKEFLAHLDSDTQAAFDAALERLKAAGVQVVEGPRRSAFSTIMSEAFGTSTPTSITVVATSNCVCPSWKARMTVSFSAGFMRPWISATRSSGKAAVSTAAVSVAASACSRSDSSMSGHTQYVWRPSRQAACTRATTSARRVSGNTTVSTGLRPGGSSSMTDTSRSA